MSKLNDQEQQARFKSAVTITVIGVAVVTLVIIFLALFAGLWLDKILNSKPIFTVGLMITSIPVTLVLVFRVVRMATDRIKPIQTIASKEEPHRE